MAALVFTHTLTLTQGVQSRTSTATTLNVPETQTRLINLFVCSSDLYAATFQEGYKAAEIDLRNLQRQEPGHTLLYVCQGDTTPALLSSRCRRDGGGGEAWASPPHTSPCHAVSLCPQHTPCLLLPCFPCHTITTLVPHTLRELWEPRISRDKLPSQSHLQKKKTGYR